MSEKLHGALLSLMAVSLLMLPTASVSAQTQQLAPVQIWTSNANGEPVYDICYELEGAAPAECDQMRDGYVEFAPVPHGTYIVLPVYPTPTQLTVTPFQITVDADNTVFHVTADSPADIIPSEHASDENGIDLNLITRDPISHAPLAGACYELLGDGITPPEPGDMPLGLGAELDTGGDTSLHQVYDSACDSEGLGYVSFDRVPYSQYVVRQSTALEGFEPINDYHINVNSFGQLGNGPVNIPLVQAPEQGHETSTVYMVFVVNADTGERIASPQNCITFMVDTKCDSDIIDGQIDFMSIYTTWGQPILEPVTIACGYDAAGPNSLEMHWFGDEHITLVQNVIPNGESCAGADGD